MSPPLRHWFVTSSQMPSQLLIQVKRFAVVNLAADHAVVAQQALRLAQGDDSLIEVFGPGGSVWLNADSDLVRVADALREMMGVPDASDPRTVDLRQAKPYRPPAHSAS